MPLTDIKIKSLKLKEKPYKVFDGGGLYIYVSAAGSKTFRIKYTFNKKENIYTVGEYPQVSLRDARFRLLEIKELISQGIDPAVEKKKNIPQAEANMFREVALEWTEKQKNKWSEVSMLRMKTDVGEKFTEIVLPDADGKEISLSSVIGKEGCRYVLLDFWASWCGPCMGEVPFLKDTYAEFHGKGFEIYGVSLDSKREKWIEAIENNGMDWIHVCSFDAFQDEFAQAYAVRSIPSNFLIDSEGRIVAVNLRGHELYETVSGLMK